MNEKRKLISGSILGLLGLLGVGMISPSYAFGGYYHHHHPHYYHGRDNLAIGLFFGTGFGMMAGAAINQPAYYGSCRRVYFDRYCRYDMWGDQSCYVEKRVEYVC